MNQILALLGTQERVGEEPHRRVNTPGNGGNQFQLNPKVEFPCFDVSSLGLYCLKGIDLGVHSRYQNKSIGQVGCPGYSRSQIAARCIEAYLIQMLKTGFFHADPHPGNLAIDEDEAIIYYDFGMMGEIKTFTRERLLDLFYAVYEKDTKKVVKSFINLGSLQPTGDLSAVRRSVKFFLDNSLSQTIDQQQTMSAIGEDLFSIVQDQPFRFPTAFAFMIRAFSTLEGRLSVSCSNQHTAHSHL
ncbi:hypothetical protein Cgig2_017387 [Carnegiea gigantea]|uniref:ABC1 atypical kinase-like domain-containing protein n=1 Tax=Carnegiea gigantea TaxID=171969 RepID=A0A9Q1GQP2_9CARY|nr:hypothetical protein Cgig2_017387 [Carnegiea gigantea]